MRISPFTPLFFNLPKSDGIDSRYIQTFGPGDEILIEVIGLADEDPPEGYVACLTDDEIMDELVWGECVQGDMCVWHTTINVGNGLYYVHIDGIGDSQPYRGTSDPTELDDTVLIRYSMKDNRSRTDALFIIDDVRRYFEFRVPGGFKDSEWSFGVTNSQFTTDKGDIVELYASETTQKNLTVGNSDGCPIWFGEMLNRILCCHYVFIDGERYARSGNNTPQVEAVQEGVNSFVFTQQVQTVNYLMPDSDWMEYIRLRSLEDGKFRISKANSFRLIK